LSLLLRRTGLEANTLVSIDADAEELLRDVLGRGAGCVFVSAHIGPFEAVAAAVAELGFHPAIVVRESYDPRLDPLVDAHRHRRGVEVIHRGHPGAAARLLRALRAGRPVGVLPDLGGRVSSAPAELCGQTVAWPVGPQRIALRAGAPVLIGTLAPEGDRGGLPHFRLLLTEVSAPDEAKLTQRVTDTLSAAIYGAPEHWPWMSGRLSSVSESNGSLRKNP
jgi:KDO2-lipid IV(A) lauroyltransferase